jgi:hypothetical protein
MSDVQTQALTSQEAAGTVETKADYEKNPGEFTKHWLKAIELAGEEEKDWRAQAADTLKRYTSSKSRSFNVLYANTQTTVPALYNSEPAPDVRRRFGEDDEEGQALAETIERFVSIQSELYDFNSVMKAAVKDRQLPGRGVSRMRLVSGPNGSKWVQWESIAYDDFRHGPAKTWDDVPWIAYRHKFKRDEIIEIAGKAIGDAVPLEVAVGETPQKDATNLPDMFKRALVWEVWDREARKVYFFAEGYPNAPLKVYDDPYKLRKFWPSPKPLYQIERTESLVPVCEFTIWKPLADEVDDITKRIAGIVKVMKLRGLYSGQFENLMAKLSGLDDGEMAAADDAARTMQDGGFDKAIWMWPVDMAIQVVQGLYEAREQAKNHLYELTGVADILRGQTNANETLGAQQIKAQWGSLRLQEAQADVQRYARDCYRLMADIMGLFAPEELAAMTGVPLGPQIVQLLQMDLQREFVIEIETDSTIKADLSRAQQNIAGFVQGFGQFIQSVGPAVQAGMMPPEIAVKLLTAFARSFKLGREAESALDAWEKFLEQKAQQPPQPDPQQQAAQVKAEAEKQRAAADVQKTQLDMQAGQQEHAQKMQQTQMAGQVAVLKHQLDLQGLQAKVAAANAMPQQPQGQPQ